MIKTQEQFRQEVIQSIHSMFPKWQAEPNDEFAIAINANGRDGRMNLHNLYHEVQSQRKPKQVLIQHFLSEFAKVIGNTENPLDNWDLVKNKISLVVRPTDLYGECLGNNYDEQLAFSLPILPDLALYWVVDNTNNWQYITNAQFSKWKVHPGRVMWWAYENTCKAEECMQTAEIHEAGNMVGLMISTKRKLGTVSHLLYEPRNLQSFIQSELFNRPERACWLCIPVPNLIVVAKEGYDEAIRKISLVAQEHYGKILSNKIYVFSNDNFTGEVIYQPNQKDPVIVGFEGRIAEAVLPD
jgi:hypothetical protein